ncbi:MAG: potassium channel family protein, partial [Myxococcota bacterium]
AYLGTCLVFAGLFALDPGGIEGAESTADLLWFSVQTLSTIGYGGMTPASPLSNLLVIIESFIGLAGVAVVTAILYAKFSLPEARVKFSDTLAVHDYGGVPTLHFRMVNERSTAILDAELHVGAVIDESDDERRFTRMHDIDLVRSRVPFFILSFTAMHPLAETSPLRRLVDADRLRFLIVTLRGVDARTLQPLFTRAMFTQEQVRFGMGFGDMVETGEDGVTELDLRRLHDLVPRPFTRFGSTEDQQTR